MAGAGRNMQVGLNDTTNNLIAFRWISAYLTAEVCYLWRSNYLSVYNLHKFRLSKG
jgi:hypothetical protein